MQNSLCYLPIYGDLNALSLEKLKELLSANYKKIAVFSPMMTGKFKEFFCFSKYEAQNLLSEQPDEFFQEIIKQHSELCKNYDFVIVLGTNLCTDLNYHLIKNLNLPVVLNNGEVFYAKECERRGVEILARIDEKKLYFRLESDGEYLEEVCGKSFCEEFKKCKFDTLSPLRFEYELYQKALANKKKVVLPEGFDERILRASDIILKSGAVDLIILGDEGEIKVNALNLGLNLDNAEFINLQNNEYSEKFANKLYELRKEKGLSLEQARELMKDKSYFGTMLVNEGIADAMVSGASTTTAETIRPALQIVKTKPGVSTVSGAFFMCLDTKVMLFADCAITPNPTPEQLAMIAKSSSDSAKAFGMEPLVAMLSYSTGDSGKGISIDQVKEATRLAKEYGDFEVDGPLQFDAAVDKEVAKKKMPSSKVAGNANVFVFPDLNCGNIAYKAVQRSANAVAIGPILQGLKKPINDLSRGCLVKDIVNTILVSAIQAGFEK